MFPDVLRIIILDYASTWELLDWIKPNKLVQEELVENPNAVDFMIKNWRNNLWGRLHCNPNRAAFLYLRDNMPCLIDIDYISDDSCKDAVQYSCDRVHQMEYPQRLSRNPFALPWLRKHPHWINWNIILENPSEDAKNLLIEHEMYDKIPRGKDYKDCNCKDDAAFKESCFRRDMASLCRNPSDWALEIVSRNIQGTDFDYDLENNANPLAKGIIAKRRHMYPRSEDELPEPQNILPSGLAEVKAVMIAPETADWGSLSSNIYAIDLLRKNPNMIDWEYFSSNPAIFELRHPKGVFELL
jgi:hypothetical protein